jgi:hypothetical protein
MPLTVIHTSALAARIEVWISLYASVGMGLPVLVMVKLGEWAMGNGHWRRVTILNF